MDSTKPILGVSRGALAQAEKQLSKNVPLVVLVAALGAALVDSGHYLIDRPTGFVATLVVLYIAMAALALFGLRNPPSRANPWTLATYVAFATTTTLSAYLYQGQGSLVNFGILNLAALYFMADRRYLIAALAYGFLCIGISTASMIHLDFWHAELLACVMCTIAGLAVHIGRIRVLEEIQDTRNALQLESEERRKAEDVLLLAQRRETLGVMVGGVTHDFNNYLLAIGGNIELASIPEVSNDQRRGYLAAAADATRAATVLCRTLLDHVNGEVASIGPVDLNAVVTDAVQLAGLRASPDVTLSVRLQPLSLSLVGDQQQLRQSIVNLIANAIDISPETVIVTTFVDMRMGELCAGVSVRDDGPGIEAGMQERIFDPFFTTKASGRGLGLAAVAATVTAQHGQIAVESSESGTEFQMWLPLLSGAASVVRAEKAPQPTIGATLMDLVDLGSKQSQQEHLDHLFRVVFDQMHCLVFFKDTHNKHLKVNSLVSKLRGAPRDEMEASPAVYWHGDDAAKYYQDDLEVIRTRASKLGIVESVEVSPGDKRWFRTDKHPWCAASGEVTGILVICQPLAEGAERLPNSSPQLSVVSPSEAARMNDRLSVS